MCAFTGGRIGEVRRHKSAKPWQIKSLSGSCEQIASMHASWLLPLSHPLSPLSLLPLFTRLIHLHDLRLLPLFSRFSFSRDRALRCHLRAFSLSSLLRAVTALPFTLYAPRSTSFLPAANFRASFSRDTTPVGCRGYTFIFVNFAFRFCGAGETVLREPCPTWKCNFAEPNPPDTDAALNADATATNWGGFISVRRGTARWWVRWSRNW